MTHEPQHQPQDHGKHHEPSVADATLLSPPPTDDKLEQQHSLFTRYKDPCRLGPGEEKPWAIGKQGAGLPMGFLRRGRALRQLAGGPKVLVSP